MLATKSRTVDDENNTILPADGTTALIYAAARISRIYFVEFAPARGIITLSPLGLKRRLNAAVAA